MGGFILGKFLEDGSKDPPFIDFLKLRASYGIIGNDRIQSFRFLSLVNGEGVYVFDNALSFGQALGSIANPEIRWEKQKPFNVEDAGLFKKIDLTVDYFNKKTEDLLVQPEVLELGASAPVLGVPL